MWANRGPAFEISLSRLHRIETTKVIPGIHGLYALAVIYRRTVDELLSFYGIDVKPGQMSNRIEAPHLASIKSHIVPDTTFLFCGNFSQSAMREHEQCAENAD